MMPLDVFPEFQRVCYQARDLSIQFARPAFVVESRSKESLARCWFGIRFLCDRPEWTDGDYMFRVLAQYIDGEARSA